jgi:hypothetical protein
VLVRDVDTAFEQYAARISKPAACKVDGESCAHSEAKIGVRTCRDGQGEAEGSSAERDRA